MTRSSLKLLHVLAPVVAVIFCLAATAWLSFRGAMELERGLDLVQDQLELGELVGATRESVNKLLRRWSEGGIIRLEQGVLTVLDPAALRDVADMLVD